MTYSPFQQKVALKKAPKVMIAILETNLSGEVSLYFNVCFVDSAIQTTPMTMPISSKRNASMAYIVSALQR